MVVVRFGLCLTYVLSVFFALLIAYVLVFVLRVRFYTYVCKSCPSCRRLGMHVRIGLYMKITVYQALLYGWHLSVTLIPSSFRPPMLAPEFWRRTHHQIHYAIIWCAHFWRVSFLPAIITRIVITTEVILKTTLSLSLSLSLSLGISYTWASFEANYEKSRCCQ